uniref:IP07155p1 n=3 Tax=Drosophila melanogaster TaxID=7227 RepID=Q4V5H5_DROME|nr:IP07155p1 [Drosophila melanogaster]AOQ12855.1 CG15673-PC [synthetic construct]
MPHSRIHTMWPIMIGVIIASSCCVDGQSYLFSVENVLHESARPLPYNLTNANGTTEVELFPDTISNNTRIIVYKNTVVESPNDLSQTAMDVITIVWYVATFLALAAFFMLMACSDRRCRDMRRRPAGGQSTEGLRAPPTPSPSYSEFAPPSYDTVIKMQHAAKTSVFVIPFSNKAGELGAPPSGTPPPTSNPLPAAVTCDVIIVNELQKSAD